jgi:putative ABC transport system substrate-binding protein
MAGGLLAAPLAAEAQMSPRVGYLSIGSASDPRRTTLLGAFQQGLRDLGYVEGKNILIEVRFAEGDYDRIPDLAAELVRLKVDIIVAYSTVATRAAQNATTSIPIVMSAVVDPVTTGLVAGLGQPGGNVTGLSLMAPEVVGKQLQLLEELVPKSVPGGCALEPGQRKRQTPVAPGGDGGPSIGPAPSTAGGTGSR